MPKKFEYSAVFQPAAIAADVRDKVRLPELERTLNAVENSGWWLVQVLVDPVRDGFIVIGKRELAPVHKP